MSCSFGTGLVEPKLAERDGNYMLVDAPIDLVWTLAGAQAVKVERVCAQASSCHFYMDRVNAQVHPQAEHVEEADEGVRRREEQRSQQ